MRRRNQCIIHGENLTLPFLCTLTFLCVYLSPQHFPSALTYPALHLFQHFVYFPFLLSFLLSFTMWIFLMRSIHHVHFFCIFYFFALIKHFPSALTYSASPFPTLCLFSIFIKFFPKFYHVDLSYAENSSCSFSLHCLISLH